MVEMFTRASTKKMKEKVLKSFVDVQSKLRLVVATTAFSIGIDCPNVRLDSIFKKLAEQAEMVSHQQLCCSMAVQENM